MRPFEENPSCEKCGASGAHIKLDWRPRGEGWNLVTAKYDMEDLSCTCTRCQFTWSMAVKKGN